MLRAYLFWKRLQSEEDGLGTVEIIIIIAVLVIIALLFKERIVEFVENLLDKVFDMDKIDKELGD